MGEQADEIESGSTLNLDDSRINKMSTQLDDHTILHIK